MKKTINFYIYRCILRSSVVFIFEIDFNIMLEIFAQLPNGSGFSAYLKFP
jgi:hypothetical protein